MIKAEMYPECQNFIVYDTDQFRVVVNKISEKYLKFTTFKYQENENTITLYDSNAVDFLYKFTDYYDSKNNKIHIKIVDDEAVIPGKVRGSDAGYDLTIIKLHKQLTPKTALYDTGIQLSIPAHHYVEIVPRSSISKTGYILANNVGIIDSSYTGNIYVALTKVDESMPDIELPCRICQLLLKKQYFMNFNQMDQIEGTSRGEGGFGSTN